MPTHKARMFPREHLVDRLSADRDHRLIVICGPAGSGKTSLACQWIRQNNLPYAWYSLDKTDDDFHVFSCYLLTALSNLDDGFASVVEQWRQEQKRLSTEEIIPFVIQQLNSLNEDKYLVLDGYHAITSKEIHDELLYFIAHIPQMMHLVIISRNRIPFSLSQFRLRNQITELSAEDLRFNGKETELFISDMVQVKLSADEIHELDHFTEGWASAMWLFASSLQRKVASGLSGLLGKVCQQAADFLVDEVINLQSEKVKAFLYTTVLLDRFNTDLCKEVSGFADAPELLEQLYRNNLYLVPLNTERTWYRYHHLFSKAIRERLAVLSPDMLSHVHRKAALWFARNGYMEEAFGHAFTSGDYEFAADLIEDYWLSLFDCYDAAFYLCWVAKLPREILRQRPLLRLFECIFKLESFRLVEIESIIKDIEDNQAFERYQGTKRTLCLDFISYFIYVLPHYRRFTSSDVNQFQQTPHMLSPVNKLLTGIMKVIMARCHFLQGNLSLASGILKDAAKSIFSSDSVWAKILWYKQMVEYERWQGQLHRAEALLKEGFSLLERNGQPDIQSKFLLYQQMAWVFYYRNNLEKALEYSAIASKYAEQTGFILSILEASHLRTCIYITTCEVEKADQCIQKMRKVSRATGNPDVINITEVVIKFIARNDLGWAEKWAEQRKLCMDEPFTLPFIFDCLAQIRLFYEQGRYHEAAEMAETLRKGCVDQSMLEVVLEIDLILSATLYELNDRCRAKMIMEQVLNFSEVQGYIQPFLHYSSKIVPVLLDMIRIPGIGRRASNIINIINSCGNDRCGSTVVKQLTKFKDSDLTPREAEILKLMAAGYRNKEIAEKVFVSIETVKSHTKNIFRKLEVKTRVQAVRQAEGQRLFEIN